MFGIFINKLVCEYIERKKAVYGSGPKKLVINTHHKKFDLNLEKFRIVWTATDKNGCQPD